ncbi:MAG: hypothetical protein O7E52_08540 [Candidatus Poribacteria bacterium]|nr:hypothetical protein [Candidatus Poribacteria bacterium]
MDGHNRHPTAILILSVILALICCTQPGHAVREGTSNANIMIKRYERNGDFASAALWREAAADCLEIISMPMTEIMIRYYRRHGEDELVALARRELADIKAQRQYHLHRAKAHWEKSKTVEAKHTSLDAERAKIAQFIAAWVPSYPDKFYDFGVYANFFKRRQEGFKGKGDYAAALNLEADAAEMCADQYNEITVAYFRRAAEQAENSGQAKAAAAYRQRAEQYEQVRDAYRRRAALLRALALSEPKVWPAEADKREITPSETKTRLTPAKVIQLANADPRIQEILAAHKDAREYAWFQGFGWTVSYYNHGWGNLAIVLVDDKTGTVIDVLNSIGNLEAREWDEVADREIETLRLNREQVEPIVRKHHEITAYFKIHPQTRLAAAFSTRYGCWIVEVIEGDQEVGFVSVSDQTGEVLEVEIGPPE